MGEVGGGQLTIDRVRHWHIARGVANCIVLVGRGWNAAPPCKSRSNA